MIDTSVVAKALEWFESNLNPPTRVKEWRKARNEWLRSHGIGGVMKEDKKSKSLPPWWGNDTLFWFTEEDDEKRFINKFS